MLAKFVKAFQNVFIEDVVANESVFVGVGNTGCFAQGVLAMGGVVDSNEEIFFSAHDG